MVFVEFSPAWVTGGDVCLSSIAVAAWAADVPGDVNLIIKVLVRFSGGNSLGGLPEFLVLVALTEQVTVTVGLRENVEVGNHADWSGVDLFGVLA